MRTSFAAMLACTAVLQGCVIHLEANNADIKLQQTLQLDSQDIASLKVEAGAGNLIIEGVDGMNEIVVNTDIFTTQERRYQLTLSRVGDKAVLIAKHNTNGIWHESPKIDVTMRVPSHLLMDIEDGSGELVVRNMDNDVDINDASGALTVMNINGRVDIEDGSGSITVDNVAGDLQIDDGSGDLSVTNVVGSVDIEDGSGAMRVADVGGMVTIDDGSGAISVEKTGGLIITEAGSGGLSFNQINGEVRVDS
ncbi:hypothetical protein [Thalassotalea maritima]|uniref:hypothetical protein n=1 Tax=Thalassotalea maritima TaxID=3242416 RepID=UPI003527963F